MAKPNFTYSVPCPKCGAGVDVVFTGTMSDRTSKQVSLTLTQAEPMVCACGFVYAPAGTR